MRLFLALNIEAQVRQRCYAATAALRTAGPDVRWVDEGKLHLTLKFLGDQPETLVTGLAPVIDAAAGRSRVMDLSLGGIGAFPNFRRPRVVWLGVTPDPKLELLHNDVEVACEKLGLSVEGRPFRPHVTLGRVESGDGKALREAARGTKVRETSAVRSIDLILSAGGQYRVLHASLLGGG
jgi:RNA 2',3'-cyclic 3'-phosphodiesterase